MDPPVILNTLPLLLVFFLNFPASNLSLLPSVLQMASFGSYDLTLSPDEKSRYLTLSA